MSGGPSHVDLFDPKPDLMRLAGQPIPESFGSFKTRRAVAKNKLLPPCRPFSPRGQCGIEISDFLPHIAALRRRSLPPARLLWRQRHASGIRLPDEHRHDSHGQAEPRRVGGLRPRHRKPKHARLRGDARSRRLGERRRAGVGQRLPARRVSGHHPARRRVADPESRTRRRASAPGSSNRPSTSSTSSTAAACAAGEEDSELAARISAYELAFRMQSHAPEVVDIAEETAATRQLYGLDQQDHRGVRPALPLRPAHGRARRPLRAALLRRHQRLGRPQRRGGQPRQALRAKRSARRRPAAAT